MVFIRRFKSRHASITLTYVLCFFLGFFIANKCTKSKKVETLKEIVIEKKVVDTVRLTNTISKPTKVFVEKIVIEYDTIIKYVDVATETSIEANKYKETLKGKHGEADIFVTTTGQLLDLKGVLRFTERETIRPMLVRKNNLYLGGHYNTNDGIESNLYFDLKQKIIISGGIGIQDNQTYYKVGVAIPIF